MATKIKRPPDRPKRQPVQSIPPAPRVPKIFLFQGATLEKWEDKVVVTVRGRRYGKNGWHEVGVIFRECANFEEGTKVCRLLQSLANTEPWDVVASRLLHPEGDKDDT